MSRLLDQKDCDEKEGHYLSRNAEDAIKWTAGTLYGAGADTTSGTLAFFILAMVQFP